MKRPDEKALELLCFPLYAFQLKSATLTSLSFNLRKAPESMPPCLLRNCCLIWLKEILPDLPGQPYA